MALFPNEHETIEGTGRALRAGQTTCVAVLHKCFDRIEEWEPRIKAWVRVDRAGAIEQARARDEELAAGRDRGPLHGIPIGIKDIIDVKGLPTAAGFGPWRDRMAGTDAHLVALLRNAGAVIMGKTVTTHFAWIDPPPTRNPWNLDRTPGGSSSGSAAAVAVGMCLGAIGSQTGGSIIRPASFCGVCGLKPAYLEVSHTGVFPFAPSLDHPGPIARSIGDLRLLFNVIRLPWLRETRSRRADPLAASPSPMPQKEKPRVAARASIQARAIRLARLRGFFDRRAEPVMTEALERALAALASAGATVIDLPDDAPDFEAIIRDHRIIMCVEAAVGHEDRFREQPENYGPQISALIQEGLATPATHYLRARTRRQEWIDALQELLARDLFLDALVMPATVGPAPDLTTTGDPAFNSPWSYLSWPAVSFPIGLAPDGLPLAIQLVEGREGRTATVSLLETASWCEDVIRRAHRASAWSN
jgi:aspartyl-tRNA(Asn)/glutamyl-tRNA(Gln) amidotransferase subunit A